MTKLAKLIEALEHAKGNLENATEFWEEVGYSVDDAMGPLHDIDKFTTKLANIIEKLKEGLCIQCEEKPAKHPVNNGDGSLCQDCFEDARN